MDDLAISPEELALVTGTSSGQSSSSSSSAKKAGIELGSLPGLGVITDVDYPAPPLADTYSEPLSTQLPTQSSGAARKNVTANPVQFAPLEQNGDGNSPTNLELLLGVTLQVTVELGRTRMNIEEILHLGPGSVVELDKLAGEPVDVLVNDKMIARGEVVVLDDRFGVRITDVLPPVQRIKSLR